MLLSVQTSPPLFIVLTHFFSSQVVVPNIGLKACALLAARTNYNQCADVPKSHNPPPFFFFSGWPVTQVDIFKRTWGYFLPFQSRQIGCFFKGTRGHLQCFLRRPRDVGPTPSSIEPTKTGTLRQAMMFFQPLPSVFCAYVVTREELKTQFKQT